MKTQTLVTIPKNIAKMGELEKQKLLRLSREAKNLKKEGHLSILRSLRDFR